MIQASLHFSLKANVGVHASLCVQPSEDIVLGPVKTLGNPQVVDYLTFLDGSGGAGGG